MNTNIKITDLDKSENKKILKHIINCLYTFEDLDSTFDMNSMTANFYCPFHPSEGLGENRNSPAAKLFYNEDEDIHTIYCFASRKSYTAYDYMTLVMKQNAYNYLCEITDKHVLEEFLKSVEKGYIDLERNYLNKKIDYINNVFSQSASTACYIETLYTNSIN